MVYEHFKSASESQAEGFDRALIIDELSSTSFKSASQAFRFSDNNSSVENLLGSVFLIAADVPAEPFTEENGKSGDLIVSQSGESKRATLDKLQTAYGVFVTQISTTNETRMAVYQNNKLQFVTNQADLEAELKKQGFHELKDLGFDKDTLLSDYFGYVKRHFGFNAIHIVTGSGSTFHFYDSTGKQVIAGSPAELQKHIETQGLKPVSVEPSAKKLVTHLPLGQTSIEYPDGSEILLSGGRAVARYTTARGDVITPENFERTRWRTPGGAVMEGRFVFSANGKISFDSTDAKCLLAKRTFSSPRGVEDTYRDGTIASFSDGVFTRAVDADGTKISIETVNDEKIYAVVLPDSRQFRFKEKSSGSFVSLDESKPLSGADQLALHTRFGNLYAKLDRVPEAIKHQEIVLDAAEKNYTPGSVELVEQHKKLADLKSLKNPTGADWHKREVAEIKRVADYLGRVNGASDDLMRLLLVTSALPGNIQLNTAGNVVRLDFNDAGKTLEAIPGLRLPGTRDIQGLKTISLNGNKLSIEGKGSFKFKLPDSEIVADINFANATCDINCDPRDPKKLRLSNFRGLSIAAGGANIQPESLILSTDKSKDGTDILKIEFGKLIPAVDAKDGPGLAALGFKLPDVPPAHLSVPHQVRLDRLFEEALNWSKSGDKKDAGKMFEAIVGLYANTEISNVFTDIKQLNKTGNKFEIETNGRDLYSIGGLPLSWDRKVSGELAQDGGKILLSKIEGAKIKVVFPADVANGLGIKTPVAIAFKEIALGEPDKDGNRIATIRTDSILESVSIKIGPKFEPVRDKQGRVIVEASLKRDDARTSVKIMANPDQLMKADPANIEFAVTVTGGSDKVAQILQGFIGHELDPTVKELLNGVESVTKVGDQVTITREGESLHEKSGLKVHVAKSVGFKIDSKAPNLELRDITGINIVDLPDVAGKIYAHKMPVTMRYLSLSNADKQGERILELKANGVVSSATIHLDASMKPKEIVAVVENPVKHMKETMVNRNLIARQIDMVTKGKSYAIRINANGFVDLDGLGGVGGVSDMLLNGGDLVSVEGAAATAVGYLGTSMTRGKPAASRALGEKVTETVNILFR